MRFQLLIKRVYFVNAFRGSSFNNLSNPSTRKTLAPLERETPKQNFQKLFDRTANSLQIFQGLVRVAQISACLRTHVEHQVTCANVGQDSITR